MSHFDRTKALVTAESANTLLEQLATTAAEIKSPALRYIVLGSAIRDISRTEYKSSFIHLVVAINDLDKLNGTKDRTVFRLTFKTGLQSVQGGTPIDAHLRIYRMYARLVYSFNGFEAAESFTDLRDSVLKELAAASKNNESIDDLIRSWNAALGPICDNLSSSFKNGTAFGPT